MSRRPTAADPGLLVRSPEAKVQLGARISEAKYRQLKLAAVLRGVAVQVPVQRAQAHELGIVLPEKVKIRGFGAVCAHGKHRHMRRNPPDFN